MGNPCLLCGYTADEALQVFCFFEVIISLFYIGYPVAFIIYVESIYKYYRHQRNSGSPSNANYDYSSSYNIYEKSGWDTFFQVLVAAMWLVKFSMAFVLMCSGRLGRSSVACWTWIVVTILNLFLMNGVAYRYWNWTSYQIPIFVLLIVPMMYVFYGMWIVYDYVRWLQSGAPDEQSGINVVVTQAKSKQVMDPQNLSDNAPPYAHIYPARVAADPSAQLLN